MLSRGRTDRCRNKRRDRTAREFELCIRARQGDPAQGIYQINDRLWKGSFYPRMPEYKQKKHNVYVRPEKNAKIVFSALIEKVKTEVAEMKAKATV